MLVSIATELAQESAITIVNGGQDSGEVSDFLLLEDGSFLLLETGDKILLENSNV